MTFKEFVKEVKLKPPFILEDSGNYIMDSNNVVVMQIRGWGHFQYLSDGNKKQDLFAEFVLSAMNKEVEI